MKFFRIYFIFYFRSYFIRSYFIQPPIISRLNKNTRVKLFGVFGLSIFAFHDFYFFVDLPYFLTYIHKWLFTTLKGLKPRKELNSKRFGLLRSFSNFEHLGPLGVVGPDLSIGASVVLFCGHLRDHTRKFFSLELLHPSAQHVQASAVFALLCA